MAKPGSQELRKGFMKTWEEKARRETKIETGQKKNPDLRADFFFLFINPSGKRMHSIVWSSFKVISFGGEK